MTGRPTPTAEYLRFVAWVVAVAAVVALLGYLPTRRLGGEGAIPALLAGCAIGALASVLGGLPTALIRGGTPAELVTRLGASTAIRLAAVVILGAVAFLSGWVPLVPLLLWIAISYVALLGVDVWYALRSQGTGKNVETR